ncbi:RICIN domain-containing protein [Kitasatospora sp. NPDC087861]
MPVPPAVGTLKNPNGGKCLEVAGPRTDNGAPAGMWEGYAHANQSWWAY